MRMTTSERGGITIRGLFFVTILVAAGSYWLAQRGPQPVPLNVATSAAPKSKPVVRFRTSTPPQPVITQPARLTTGPVTVLPSSSEEATLKLIAGLLQQDRIAEAQAQLNALSPTTLANLRYRQYAAVLWNNLGVAQANNGGSAAGLASFKTAVSLNPSDASATVNLTRTLWENKDRALTRDFLENAVRVASTDPLPHLALANLLYDSDDLAGATVHLDHAIQHSAAHPELREYLQVVTAKVRRAGKAEQNYLSRQSSHFTVKFNGAEDYALWTQVLDILEDAYRDIGRRFGYYPSDPIVVVLHTRDRFQDASGSPAWADGLYDGILGRIQIPTQGALTDQTWLARVLRHEFVHALLHSRVEGRIGAVPTWLNEGLAMQLAGDNWPDIEALVREEVRLIPLTALEGGWTGMPPVVARLAYLEGKSAAGYLIDRFGIGKVQEIVGLLAGGQTIGPAVQDRLFITYEDFQRRWIEELNQRIQTGRL
jgi:tetratricopeptide (TPR) repeat protein